MTAKQWNKDHEIGAVVVVYRYISKNKTLTGGFLTRTSEEAKVEADGVSTVMVERLPDAMPLSRVKPI